MTRVTETLIYYAGLTAVGVVLRVTWPDYFTLPRDSAADMVLAAVLTWSRRAEK